MLYLPLIFVLPQHDRLEVTVAVSEESELIKMEFTRDWKPRCPEDEEECAKWRARRDLILFRWNIQFVDQYDPSHPGYAAAKFGRLSKWEKLTPDWWLRTGAPIEWMEWRLKCWDQEHRMAPGWGETFGAAIQEYDDPERRPLPDPPWWPGYWEINEAYGP